MNTVVAPAGISSQSAETFRRLFKPESIVVVGASNNSGKPGGRVLKNILDNNYQGDLWAVNINSPSVMGLPTYNSVSALPATPDLAIIAVNAIVVATTLGELAAAGVKTVIVLSAGFGETGEKGRLEEEKLLALARQAEITLIGPNCLGIQTPVYAGKFAGIVSTLKPGTIDFISESGATIDFLLEQAISRGLCFSSLVALGNSIQTGVEDMLALYDENHNCESSRMILLYMESIRQPEKLLHHARSLLQKGVVIAAIKSGVSAAGQKAAASHTGAIATNELAVQALFNKAGIIRANSRMELIDIACIIASARGLVSGNKFCIVTDAGGLGVMLADELSRHGLVLPEPGKQTKKRLASQLAPESSCINPIDCLPTVSPEQIRSIFQILEQEEKETVDAIIISLGNTGISDTRKLYQEIVNAKEQGSIPVIPILTAATSGAEYIAQFRDTGHCFFQDEVNLGYALGKIVNRPLPGHPVKELVNYRKEQIASVLSSQQEMLTQEAVSEILLAAGFTLPEQITVYAKSALARACDTLCFPIAMKVVGPFHENDIGGMKTDIQNSDEAGVTWDRMLDIEGVNGIRLQKMVSGTELIMASSREQGIGQLILFGLGGIHAKILKELQFALAPLSYDESMRMIKAIKGFPVLEGIDGEQGIELDLLSDHLLRLALLVTDFPQIKKIDLIPVKGADSNLYIVDARMIQDGNRH